MDTLFEIALQTEGRGSRRAAQGLVEQLRAAIADGRLLAGTRLPPTREAQARFGVSRNTLADVYERLAADGLVETRRGSGAYVAAARPLRDATETLPGAPHAALNPFWQAETTRTALHFWDEAPRRLDASTEAIDLRPGVPDLGAFPYAIVRRVLVQQLRRLERKPPRLRSPQGNQGNYALREAITRHIAVTRAVAAEADDVLVTGGAQQAFDLLARALVRPGTVVVVENPGYPPLRVAFAAAGARIVAVDVDDEGLRVDALPADAGILCVCPSHQFPLGSTMSARRRADLVAFARARGAVIIEDDYDGEFRYDGAPLAALRTREAADLTFYVGTFSKCMLPMLRLGFVIAPRWAMPTLALIKNSLDWHSPTPLQLGVAAFVRDGHLTRHVRRMRRLYQLRRRLVLSTLAGDLARWLRPIDGAYGMHIGTHLVDAGIDSVAVVAGLREQGVHLHDIGRYASGAAVRSGFVIGFGGADLAGVRRGLDALRAALQHA